MLQDITAVVGGGSGIGRGTALALAGAGVHVAVADLNSERAVDVAKEASTSGTLCVGYELDVHEDSQFDGLRDEILERFGRVDIVMNNVGLISAGLPEHIPIHECERSISANLLSVVRCNITFLPLLLRQRSGHIVNTASTAGLISYTYERIPYSATKAGVVALSEALALYTRPRGVGVTCLCPGPVATRISESISISGPEIPMTSPSLSLQVKSAERSADWSSRPSPAVNSCS